MLRALAWYCGWLNRLEEVELELHVQTRSVSLKFLRIDISTSLFPGPEQIPTPEPADLTQRETVHGVGVRV